MAILTSNIYTANHHLDLFANHGCGLLRGGVACEFTRKSCILYTASFFTCYCHVIHSFFLFHLPLPLSLLSLGVVEADHNYVIIMLSCYVCILDIETRFFMKLTDKYFNFNVCYYQKFYVPTCM